MTSFIAMVEISADLPVLDFQGVGEGRAAEREAVEAGTDQDILAYSPDCRRSQRIRVSGSGSLRIEVGQQVFDPRNDLLDEGFARIDCRIMTIFPKCLSGEKLNPMNRL
jgi:hypothetical protein